jgi:hypothetical protein
VNPAIFLAFPRGFLYVASNNTPHAYGRKVMRNTGGFLFAGCSYGAKVAYAVQ